MVRKITRFALCFSAGLLAISLCVGGLSAEDKKDDKIPSVEEIMKKGHAGKNSLINKIKASTKAEKWEDSQKSAGEMKAFGEALGKNKVPMGDAASWKKLSEKYMKITAEVSEGADKKDAKAVDTALGLLGKSCKECHDAHKE